MRHILLKIKLFFKQLFFGLKNADDILTSQDVSNLNNGVSIQQKKEATRLSDALLRGEVTKEVEELRHRMYKVERETDFYTDKITSNLHLRTENNYTIRKELEKHDNDNGYAVKLIQHNYTDGINTYNSLGLFSDTNSIKGKDLIENERKLKSFTINVEYDSPSRVHIGRFINSVKYKTKEDTHYVDLSISKYKVEGDVISSYILSKIEKTDENNLSELDFLNIRKVDFVTFKPYKSTNGIYYSFDNLHFEKIYEYDGKYYITYRLENSPEIIDTYDKYKVDDLDEKYKTKQPKNTTPLYSFEDYTNLNISNQKTYTCQSCGKKTVKGKKVALENDSEKTEIFDNEYIDYELAFQACGEYLCSSCLKEKLYDPYIKNN